MSLAGKVSTRVELLWRNLRRLRAEGGNLANILFALGIPWIIRAACMHIEATAPSPTSLPGRTATFADGGLRNSPNLDAPAFGELGKFLHTVANFFTRQAQLIKLLKIEPKLWAGAEPVAEPQRRVGRDRALTSLALRYAAPTQPRKS